MSTPGNEEQSLVEHLTDLRKRLIYSLLFIFLGFLACWSFSEQLIDILRHPIEPYLTSSDGGLIFTHVMDGFVAHIKVAFLGGLIITCPLWIYQVWLFITPALYKNEKLYGLIFILAGSLLFLTGVAFVYFLIYPKAFEFLLSFGNKDQPMIALREYISFITTTTIIFGLAFQMPLILAILGMVEVISADFLRKGRRYAIVLLAIASAIFTPPDPLSQIMMLVPMIALYEISILLVAMMAKRS